MSKESICLGLLATEFFPAMIQHPQHFLLSGKARKGQRRRDRYSQNIMAASNGILNENA